ncbi:MAG: GTP 3',8-cyclase MoaA [Candidatus Omnitrophota bacterium]
MERNMIPDYLRLSVTDHCNLNCVYCTPLEREKFLSHDEVLRYEEMARLVRVFVSAGIRKIRLTGGEPLLKKGIVDLVKMIRLIRELEDISMTTNGVLLEGLADELKESGLDRINISLNTLREDRYRVITGQDCLSAVLRGIRKAMGAGFSSVKINVVPLKGFNEDEIKDFVRFTMDYPLSVRFIELFHTNSRSTQLLSSFVSTESLIEQIKGLGELMPVEDVPGNGPAVYYKLKGSKGTIGFISGSTKNFCGTCNRVRVDCSGRISLCLFAEAVHQVRFLLRSNVDDDELLMEIKNVLSKKQCYTKNTIVHREIEMSRLGG